MTLAAEAAVLVPDDPEMAIKIFRRILEAISRVKYHRLESQRATYPEATKSIDPGQ